MRKYLWSILILVFTASTSFIMCVKADGYNAESTETKVDKEFAEKQTAFARLKAKADSAKLYCETKGLDTQFCFLIDFSIHSGKNRFFVWDFKKDTIRYQSLCCHGYGQKSTQKKPVFSNVEGSYCSSLGRYKVGERSYSKWGINVHYKLYGLDKSNNNAFKRWVVLHSHTPVSMDEIYPRHLPLGWSQGCPVINDEVMRKVDTILKEINKPVLLWIYT